jgi:hypothetical protein
MHVSYQLLFVVEFVVTDVTSELLLLATLDPLVSS